MQDKEVLNDNEGLGLPVAYAVVASSDTECDKRRTTAHDLIHEQVKDSYCIQGSCTVWLLGSTFNYGQNEFSVRTAPINGVVKKVFPSSLEPRLYFISIIQHWQETKKK